MTQKERPGLLRKAKKTLNFDGYPKCLDEMTPKPEIALVGCGHAGRRHAPILARIGRLRACADPDPARAAALSADYGCRSYDSLDSLLARERGLDIAVICSPNGLHARQTIAALEAGLHVVCEKPAALMVKDAEDVLEAGARSRKHVFVVKQHRFNPAAVALRQLLAQGLLGKIYSVQVNCFWHRPAEYFRGTWHQDLALDGGVLFTQFSHFIDLLYWYFGTMRVLHASCQHADAGKPVAREDQGMVQMVLGEGVMASMHYSVNTPVENQEGSITVIGERGFCKIGGTYLNVLEKLDLHDPEDPAARNIMEEYDIRIRETDCSLHERFYRNMVDALAGRADAGASLREAVESVRWIGEIYRSAQTLI
jgi:predicted dehydrogenase